MAGRARRQSGAGGAGRAGRVLRVHAFAKINLDLRVLGVRPDGYHELSTTFQSIAVHDTLTFAPLADRSHPLVLTCDDPACPVDRTNLVWRAARAMWRAARRRGDPKGLRVRLVKRIPLQAGLGGGSSDAAAALRACAALWRVGDPAVRRAAARLGSDVPYFLEGGTALGLGRGDRLVPLTDRAALWVVIVLPAFGVSTKDAYGWLDAARKRAGKAGRAGRAGLETMSGEAGANDLEAPVAAHHPEIRRMIRGLERAGSVSVAMSGSGSAVFGLFASRIGAESAATSLAGRRRRTLVTRTLSRAGYERRTSVRHLS
jgi:4-diphosphocytidyl-2-C-methyl-D-erythritol kinase